MRFSLAELTEFLRIAVEALGRYRLRTALSVLGYGPGLVSSILIWGPLGIVTVVRYKRALDDQRQYWIAIAIGIGVNVIVGIMAMRGGRIG